MAWCVGVGADGEPGVGRGGISRPAGFVAVSNSGCVPGYVGGWVSGRSRIDVHLEDAGSCERVGGVGGFVPRGCGMGAQERAKCRGWTSIDFRVGKSVRRRDRMPRRRQDRMHLLSFEGQCGGRPGRPCRPFGLVPRGTGDEVAFGVALSRTSSYGIRSIGSGKPTVGCCSNVGENGVPAVFAGRRRRRSMPRTHRNGPLSKTLRTLDGLGGAAHVERVQAHLTDVVERAAFARVPTSGPVVLRIHRYPTSYGWQFSPDSNARTSSVAKSWTPWPRRTSTISATTLLHGWRPRHLHARDTRESRESPSGCARRDVSFMANCSCLRPVFPT